MPYIYRWEELEGEEHGRPSSRCRIKVITGREIQLVRAEFEPGGEYEMHRHPHEQFGMLLEGRLLLVVDGEEREIGPGDVWYVPPGVVHGGRILGEGPVVFVDFFHPVRRDLLEEMRRKRAERKRLEEREEEEEGRP